MSSSNRPACRVPGDAAAAGTAGPLSRRRWLKHLVVGVGGASAALAPLTASRAQLSPEPRAWPGNRPTPVFRLPVWEGGELELGGLRGKPVLLNFWASWCEPCRTEMPSLELLATRHEAAGLQVLAINHRETDAAVRRFLDSQPLGLPVLRDRDGAVAQAFGVRVFPTTVAIGRHGRALFSVVGEVDWGAAKARRWLEPVLHSSLR